MKKNFLAPVSKSAHKYSRGVVAISAGSKKYPGAALLTTGAARRGGAGYIQFISADERLIDLVISQFPDVVPIGNLEELKASTLLVGSGEPQKIKIPGDVALVLDGSSIALAQQVKNQITVITPHEGEVKYLGVLRENRSETALSLAKQNNCIVVLKGPGTVVASPDGRLYIDRKGGAELASAGSGDILAGLIASMLASWKPSDRDEAFEVVCKAVTFHSMAGKLARKRANPVVATDILNALSLLHK